MNVEASSIALVSLLVEIYTPPALPIRVERETLGNQGESTYLNAVQDELWMLARHFDCTGQFCRSMPSACSLSMLPKGPVGKPV